MIPLALVEQHVATAEFDEKVFSLDCVKRAAYSLADLFAVDISLVDGKVRCVLHPTDLRPGQDLSGLVNRLRIAVVDYDLRESIRQETEAVRSTILAFAYSKTNLQSGE